MTEETRETRTQHKGPRTQEVAHDDCYRIAGLSVNYAITVEKVDAKTYSVKLPLFGEQWNVSTLEEAQKKARERFPEIDFESHVLESHEKGEDDTTLVEASVEVLLDKLKAAWEDAVSAAA